MRSALLLLAPLLAFGQANPWYQTDFPPDEFKARWARIFEKIGSSAVALLQGVPQTNGFIMPRQSNDFYYLCGIETPHAYLLLGGRDRRGDEPVLDRLGVRQAQPGHQAGDTIRAEAAQQVVFQRKVKAR